MELRSALLALACNLFFLGQTAVDRNAHPKTPLRSERLCGPNIKYLIDTFSSHSPRINKAASLYLFETSHRAFAVLCLAADSDKLEISMVVNSPNWFAAITQTFVPYFLPSTHAD